MLSIPVLVLFSLAAAWLAVELGDPAILLGWYDVIVISTDSDTNPWQDLVRDLRERFGSYE